MSTVNRIRVCLQGHKFHLRKGEVACIIGRHVTVDTRALENYCFRVISDQDYELALLAGVVAYADRKFRRRYSAGWARNFDIVMPVRDPARWERKETKSALRNALEFLTGDGWSFEFIGNPTPWHTGKQQILDLGRGRFVVVPYSAGLDSFAQSQLLKLEGGAVSPIRITAWNQGVAGCRDWMREPDGTKYRSIPIPVRVSTTNHPEPTFRTRSFLFLTFAGIAARLADAEAIVIPENGQGSVGPSLVPFGAESPQRGSHPAFTRLLGQLLNSLWRNDVPFQHRQLWRTKAEVLRLLSKEGLIDGWERTRSCPRDRRHVNLCGKSVQCGVCSGCLLRRMSSFVAGLSESEGAYLWNDLRAPSLDAAMHQKADRETTANDRDIANHGVLAMAELAAQADTRVGNHAVEQSAFEIADARTGDGGRVLRELRRLLNAHRDEWMQFTDHVGPSSWVRSIADNL